MAGYNIGPGYSSPIVSSGKQNFFSNYASSGSGTKKRKKVKNTASGGGNSVGTGAGASTGAGGGGSYYGYNVGDLIDRQLNETDQFRQQQSSDREKALGLLSGYDPNKYNNQDIIKDELARFDSNPFGDVNNVRKSIQSILDNPNVLSDEELQRQRDAIRSQSVLEQSQAQQANRDAAGARGMADSGLTAEQQAMLGNMFGAQRYGDIANLEYKNKLDSANRLTATQGLGSNLELGLADLKTRGKLGLLDMLRSQGETAGRLDLERLGAMSELYGNTERIPNDYGGIASLILAQQNADADRSLQGRQYGLLEDQLAQQKKQFDLYGQLLQKQLNPAPVNTTTVHYPETDQNKTYDLLSEYLKQLMAQQGSGSFNPNYFSGK